MKLEKRDGALLMVIGVWNIVIWSNFAKNLRKTALDPEQHRPLPYYVAHVVLIVVNSIIGGVLGALGLKALRSR